MSLFNWLGKLAAARRITEVSRGDRPRPRRRHSRPAVEALEARTLLSVSSFLPNINVSNQAGSQSETGIAVNPVNPLNLVAVANDISDLTHPATYSSTDGGATWKTHFIDASVDGFDASEIRFDPNVAFGSHGRAYVLYSMGSGTPGSRLVVARSSDGGQTYPQVVQVTSDANDTVLHTATLTTRPAGATDDVLVLWARVGDTGETIQAALSLDAGATFPVVNNQIDDNAPERTFVPWAATDTAGNFQVIWEVNNDANDGQNKLPDGFIFHDVLNGTTLVDGPDTRVTDLQITDFAQDTSKVPAQPDRGIFSIGTVDVDRSNGPHRGRVYVSYTDRTSITTDSGDTNADTNIFVRSSDDNGASWSAPVQVNDDATTTSQFLPRLTVDQVTGNVHLTWYDARNDPTNNQLVDVYTSVSADGGATWAANQKITDQPSDESTADPGFGQPAPSSASSSSSNGGDNPQRDGNNYGEYEGLAVYGGVVHAVWTDARLANFTAGTNEEIYATGADVIASGGATYTVRLDPTGQFVQIFENVPVNATPTYTALLAAVHSITVNGGGDDQLTIDFANGSPIPVAGLTFDGGPGTNTLQVLNRDNTWHVTGPNTGDVNGSVTYRHAQNLSGGSGSDTFVFSDRATLSGTIDGGGGSNTLDDSASTGSHPVSLTLQTLRSGTASNLGGTFQNIQTAVGGAGVDNLTGPNADSTWNVSADSPGHVVGSVGTGGVAFNFTSFEHLSGGSGTDSFNVRVTSQSSLSLAVDGSPGSDVLSVLDVQGGAVIHDHKSGPASGTVQVCYLVGATSVITYQSVETVTTNPSAEQSFVQDLYHQFLKRNGSPAEINGWVAALQGPGGRTLVANGIIRSQEARTLLVQSWYVQYLKRPASGGEEQGWVNLLLAGFTEETVLASFLNSPEYYQRAGLQDGPFLQNLYQDGLGRPAGGNEVALWLGSLQSTSGRSGTAWLVFNSVEYRARLVQADYQNLLMRAGSAAELAGWVLSGLDATTLAVLFATSQEFFDNGC